MPRDESLQAAERGTAPPGADSPTDSPTNIYPLHGRASAWKAAWPVSERTWGRSEEAARDRGADAAWGQVLDFPARGTHRFTSGMRDRLERLAATTPGPQAVLFGTGNEGSDWCRFGTGLMIRWEEPDGMTLTDMLSGYVDHGPFNGIDGICRAIEGLKL